MYPSGAEFDAFNERLVVADTGLDRVLLYGTEGTRLGEFGSTGTGDGQFVSPRDVAVDEAGSIYVADAENNRVQKFDAGGTHLWTIGGIGRCDACLNTPIGVTWDKLHDVLLVASTGQSLVKAFDADGTWLWSSPDAATSGLQAPRDVARGPDGRIWVADYKHHQVKAYDVTASGVWTTSPTIVLGDGLAGGSGDGQLNFPYNMTWSLDGSIVYISDTGNGRIARWDLAGPSPVWLAPLGGRCSEHPDHCPDPPAAPGEFNHLRRVVTDSAGNVYGVDFWGNGVEVFAPDGTVIRQIEGAAAPLPGFAEAYDVDVAPDGTAYVMDRLNHRVQHFAEDGSFLAAIGSRGTQPATFSWPEAVAAAPDGTLWASDTRGNRIHHFPADLGKDPPPPSIGSSGSALGELRRPEGLHVAADGVLWIADTRNNRIQAYDPTTGTFAAFGSLGADPGQVAFPEDVAVSGDAIYVADTGNDRIQKWGLDGAFVTEYATGLVEPAGIALADDGTVWIADTGNSRIVHLSADLVDIGDGFGAPGIDHGQFDRPHGIAVHAGRLYVADTYNHRVEVFALGVDDGFTPSYAFEVSDPGGVAPLYPAGGVTVPDGTRYVADSGGSRIVTIDPAGVQETLSDTGWNDPRDIALDPDGAHLWVMDTSDSEVVKMATDGAVVATFGGRGLLTTPYGLGVDTTGVYVADTYAHRVVKLSSDDGSVVWTQDACAGTSLGRPRDLTAAVDGFVYVADTDNDRIVVLDPTSGGCLGGFGSRGSGDGQFKSPRAIADDLAGGLWVADAWNYRIQHVTTSGDFLGATAGGQGEGPAQFRQPGCLFVDGARIAACDTWNHRIQLFDVDAAGAPDFAESLGGTRPSPGGFNGAFGVGYAPDGTLYAADWFNHRVQHLDADGAFRAEWGGYGSVPGAMIFPRDVLVAPDATVVLTNSEANRIDLFTADGAFLRSIKPTGSTLLRPHQTTLAADGTYWVADTLHDRVLHLDGSGAVLLELVDGARIDDPRGVAVDAEGDVYVASGRTSTIERYSSAGVHVATLATAGSGPAEVLSPHGMTIADAGTGSYLLVADTGNDRVAVFTLDGDPVTSFGTSGSGPGQFDDPKGVAFDGGTGRVAVADHTNNRVSIWTTGEDVGVDTTPPDATVTSPARGDVLPNGPIRFTGSATDDRSVDTVRVSIYDRDAATWYRPDGTWGAHAWHMAELASPGGAVTEWSLDWTPPVSGGRFGVGVRADDAVGNTDPTRPWVPFDVETAPDATPPDASVTSPAPHSLLGAGTISFEGTVTDDRAVGAVDLAIRDRDTGQWWRSDGTWGQFQWQPATLAAPGAAESAWSFDWAPDEGGRMGVLVRATDAAANTDPDKPWVPFTVDQTPPDADVTSPQRQETLPPGTVTMTGGASDDIGVAAVKVAIRDRATGLWWHAGGSWGGWALHDADLEAPGASATAWSLTWTPPEPGDYAILVRTDDLAGNTDPSRPWVPFSVAP